MATVDIGTNQDNSAVIVRLTNDDGSVFNIPLTADQAHSAGNALLRGEAIVRASGTPVVLIPTTGTTIDVTTINPPGGGA